MTLAFSTSRLLSVYGKIEMRMIFMIDGLFIHALVEELNQSLAKARIEKVVQTDDHSFVLLCYHQREKKQLMIDLSPEHFRMHLTQKNVGESKSSQFVMTLKKQIEGAIIDRITQYQTDRVVIIDLTVYDFIDGPIQKQIIFEAMGKHSNLMLIKDGVIIDTFKKMFFETGRQLLPQATFEYFPSDKKPATHIVYDNIQEPYDLVNQYMGISPILAKYLFEKRVQWNDLTMKPTYDHAIKRFYCVDLFDDSHEKTYYPTLSLLLDDDPKIDKPQFVSQKGFIDKQLKRLENKKLQLEDALESTNEQLEAKNIADTIYSSGQSLDDKVSSFVWNQQVIAIDPTKTLNEHAQRYYKLYQKAKRGLVHIHEQIEQNNELIQLFKAFSVFADIASIESMRDLELELAQYGYKKAKPETSKKVKKPAILLIKDGDLTYAIGKNNLQNEYVTHTYAQKEDWWFHVKDAPGAHVVVNAKDLNEQVLRKASMLAAYFSSLRHSSSIPVDYTKIKYIKKIPGIPSYKVTYQKQQTLYIDIDDQKINSYLKNV